MRLMLKAVLAAGIAVAPISVTFAQDEGSGDGPAQTQPAPQEDGGDAAPQGGEQGQGGDAPAEDGAAQGDQPDDAAGGQQGDAAQGEADDQQTGDQDAGTQGGSGEASQGGEQAQGGDTPAEDGAAQGEQQGEAAGEQQGDAAQGEADGQEAGDQGSGTQDASGAGEAAQGEASAGDEASETSDGQSGNAAAGDSATASDSTPEGQSESSGGEGETGGGSAEEEAHSETPHYPLRKPEEVDWSFGGMFGTYDLGQLQRGLKVYKQVCSTCHSLNLVAMRTLTDLGYSEAQVKSFASDYTVMDGPNDSGEMEERPGLPTDYFPAPFDNPQQAAAANGGAYPPDLSLIAKARAVERGFPTFVFDILTQYQEAGPDYIHALLTGYGAEPPEGVEVPPGMYFNPYFLSGTALRMPPPLSEGQVEYTDGSPETVEQYSRDVTAFLMWASEPHLPERKALGMVAMVFFVVFAVLMWRVKRRVWAGTPH